MNCRKIYTKEDIDFINKHDVLFLSGGGLFLYDTFPNDVSDWQWGISSKLLDQISIPIVVYALGYNKFRKQRNFTDSFDITVNKLVEKAKFFSLRNSGSSRAIKCCGEIYVYTYFPTLVRDFPNRFWAVFTNYARVVK